MTRDHTGTHAYPHDARCYRHVPLTLQGAKLSLNEAVHHWQRQGFEVAAYLADDRGRPSGLVLAAPHPRHPATGTEEAARMRRSHPLLYARLFDGGVADVIERARMSHDVTAQDFHDLRVGHWPSLAHHEEAVREQILDTLPDLIDTLTRHYPGLFPHLQARRAPVMSGLHDLAGGEREAGALHDALVTVTRQWPDATLLLVRTPQGWQPAALSGEDALLLPARRLPLAGQDVMQYDGDAQQYLQDARRGQAGRWLRRAT